MLKFSLVIEDDANGVVYESSAESFDILSDKFFAFERHNPAIFETEEVKEF